MDPRRLKSRIQRAVLLLSALGAIYGVQRFRLESVPPELDAMAPSYPSGGGRIVVDRYPGHVRPLARLDIVRYEAELEGRRYRLMGRLRGMPGDVLGRRDDRLTIAGQATDFDARRLPDGPIPAGYYLVLNENPQSQVADGRLFGLIPAEQIAGRVIALFPSGPVEAPDH